MPTPLHDAALSVLALHLGPDADVPKPLAFSILYHVLEMLPAYRERVAGLLRALCSGIEDPNSDALLAALQGLCMEQVNARHAALTALADAPALSGATPPSDGEVVALLWMAKSDTSPENAEAADALWTRAGSSLPAGFVQPLVAQLASPYTDVRNAAATAMAAGVQEHGPASVSQALTATIELFHSGAGKSARLGSAAALSAVAPHLGSGDLTSALNFLLSSGLVDGEDSVRSAMTTAGAAVVDAAGREHAGTMLPLFESYLEGKGAANGLSESEYDHVRQGAVVFLGTLARHMDPSSPKVSSRSIRLLGYIVATYLVQCGFLVEML